MTTKPQQYGRNFITLIAGACGLLALVYPEWRSEAQEEDYIIDEIDFRERETSLVPGITCGSGEQALEAQEQCFDATLIATEDCIEDCLDQGANSISWNNTDNTRARCFGGESSVTIDFRGGSQTVTAPVAFTTCVFTGTCTCAFDPDVGRVDPDLDVDDPDLDALDHDFDAFDRHLDALDRDLDALNPSSE